MATQLYPHIVSDPAISAGKPIVEGTSLPVSVLLAQVAAGKGLDDVARAHGVTVEDVRAAIEYAAHLADATAPTGRPAPSAYTAAETGEARPRTPSSEHHPVSDLGKRLADIRQRIVASGTPLVTWDELDAEMDEMRRRHLDEQ